MAAQGIVILSGVGVVGVGVVGVGVVGVVGVGVTLLSPGKI